MSKSVKALYVLLCVSLFSLVSLSAQEKTTEKKTGTELKTKEIKKEEKKKDEPKTDAEMKAEEEAAKKAAEEKKKLEKEKEYIKGFVSQYKAGDVNRKVLAVNAIHKAYTDKKISDKTLYPFLIGAVGNPIPRVSLIAHNHIKSASGEKFEKDSKQWQKWWDEKLKKEAEDKAKAGDASAKPGDRKKGDKDDELDEEEKKKKEALAKGKRKLVDQHNETLGNLDRLILKNGGEIECYILFVQKNDQGKIEKYIVQFKDAVGKAEFSAREVDEVEFDIDKEKGLLMPLPVLKEKEENKKP